MTIIYRIEMHMPLRDHRLAPCRRPLEPSATPGFSAWEAVTLTALWGLALAIGWLRFHPWRFETLTGDDLSNYLAYVDGSYASSLRQALIGVFAEKYRPVYAVFNLAVFRLFGASPAPYFYLALTLHALNAMLLAVTARRLSNRSLPVAFAVCAAFASSHFALFQVTYATGLLEALACTGCLATILFWVRAATEESGKAHGAMWTAVAAAFITINIHERYLVLAVWLALSAVALPSLRSLSRSRKAWLAAGALGTAISNFAFKALILKAPILVGTGGSKLGIDLRRTLVHVRQAVFSILGFNDGPEYLAGASIGQLPSWVHVPAALVLSVVAWLMVAAALRSAHGVSFGHWLARLAIPTGLLVLLAMVLVPPVVTIRLEQRWLLVPFGLLMLVLAWCSARVASRLRFASGCAVVAMAAASVTLDVAIAKRTGNVFFISSGRVGTAAFQAAERGTIPAGTSPLVFVLPEEHCHWTMLDGDFFRLYFQGKRRIRCVAEPASLNAQEGPPTSTTLLLGDDWTFRVAPKPSSTEIALASSRTAFDFVDAFSSGRINDKREVDTPGRHGAFVAEWKDPEGIKQTLTILSGFSYEFQDIVIPSGAVLHFAPSMILNAPHDAVASVAIKTQDGREARLASRHLSPPATADRRRFDSDWIGLDEYAGQKVSITFKADSTTGDQSAQWVGFHAPRLLVPSERVRSLLSKAK